MGVIPIVNENDTVATEEIEESVLEIMILYLRWFQY